jgi:hypothetical protein
MQRITKRAVDSMSPGDTLYRPKARSSPPTADLAAEREAYIAAYLVNGTWWPRWGPQPDGDELARSSEAA